MTHLILTGLLEAAGAAATASGCLAGAGAKLAPVGLLPVSCAGKLANLLAPPPEAEEVLGRSALCCCCRPEGRALVLLA